MVGAFEVKDNDNGNGGADDDDNMVGTIVGIFLVMAANCQDIYLKSVTLKHLEDIDMIKRHQRCR